MDQYETRHAGWAQPWPHCVRWGTSSPAPKGHSSSQYSAHICCGQMAAWIKMPFGMEVGRPQPKRLCVTWGPSSPPQKGGGAPQFSAHVYCGQTTGCIKIPLGTEVGPSLDDFVLDGDPAPLRKKGHSSPNFRSFLLWPNGWMHQDIIWRGARPQPRRLCVRWGPRSPSLKRGRSPEFLAHVYCGQTAGCIKIPLGAEVGISLNDIVLDGDRAPLP